MGIFLVQKNLWLLFYHFAPGIGLCFTIALLSMAMQGAGQNLFGNVFLPDALVMAIVIGVILRSFFDLRSFEIGIGFCARFLLELAVVGLGASVSIAILVESGFFLAFSVAMMVLLSIALSYGLSRLMRLPPRLALLVACGNAICGNSAIVAVASVIKAKGDEIAAAIAFTAVLGVGAVLAMPLAVPLLGFSEHQYGIFAGMSVYAVPQVLAATIPVSLAASHSGTIVKLIRVLMLGPLIFVINLMVVKRNRDSEHIELKRLIPWFIIGFALLMGLRSIDLIPFMLLEPLAQATKFLTIVSMAGLGLGVNIRTLAATGGRVMIAATLSLLTLVMMAGLFCLFFVSI